MFKRYLFVLFTFFGCLSVGAQEFNGTWSGTLDVGVMKLNLVFNISGDSCTMDSPDQGAKGIAANIKYITEDSVNISITQIGLLYIGKLADGVISGTFTQMGQSFPLNLKRGETVRLRPQTPQPPYPYDTEDITFESSDSTVLAGTITYPVNYEVTNGKCPVVLMVTGSGQQNRDEELFGHKPFLVIADYLARHGIASLRYDDRGVGKSTGDPANATSVTFMKDALAGVNYLKSLREFSRVGVLGHSEGVMIAFMLGTLDVPDFIVSMAGPSIKGDSLLTEQANAILRLSGLPPAMTVAKYREQVQRAQPIPWLEFFINHNPKNDIALTKCPVMAINGDLDVQVSAKTNLSAIKKLLPAKQKSNFIKEYPGLNHLFQHAETGAVSEYGDIEETISPEVLADIADWIKGISN